MLRSRSAGRCHSIILVAAAALLTCLPRYASCVGSCVHPIDPIKLPAWIRKCNCLQMPESHFSYRVATTAANTAADIAQFRDTSNGLIIGSFELGHSLRPSDTLFIILGSALEKRGGRDHRSCHKMAICNVSLDGTRQKLQLNVTLRLHTSYTMQILKLSGGHQLCEAPLTRFFYTRSSANELPLVQMAVRSCGNCSDAGVRSGCQMDLHLRTDRAGTQLRVRGIHGDTSGRIPFGDDNPQPRAWMKKSFELDVKSNLLTVDLFNSTQSLHIGARRSFYKIGQFDDPTTLRSQLCRPAAAPGCRAMPPTSRLRHVSAAAAASVADAPPMPKAALTAGLAMMPILAVATAAAALVVAVALLLRRRLCPPPSRRVFLVFPEAGGDSLLLCPAVRNFRRQLRASGGFGRGHLSIQELRGLRNLTPDIARDSRLLIFVSPDASFTCFQLDDLSGDARLTLRTVLTEKQRTRGVFISSGPSPPPASDWAPLLASSIGSDSQAVPDSVRDLRALWEVEEASI